MAPNPSAGQIEPLNLTVSPLVEKDEVSSSSRQTIQEKAEDLTVKPSENQTIQSVEPEPTIADTSGRIENYPTIISPEIQANLVHTGTSAAAQIPAEISLQLHIPSPNVESNIVQPHSAGYVIVNRPQPSVFTSNSALQRMTPVLQRANGHQVAHTIMNQPSRHIVDPVHPARSPLVVSSVGTFSIRPAAPTHIIQSFPSVIQSAQPSSSTILQDIRQPSHIYLKSHPQYSPRPFINSTTAPSIPTFIKNIEPASQGMSRVSVISTTESITLPVAPPLTSPVAGTVLKYSNATPIHVHSSTVNTTGNATSDVANFVNTNVNTASNILIPHKKRNKKSETITEVKREPTEGEPKIIIPKKVVTSGRHVCKNCGNIYKRVSSLSRHKHECKAVIPSKHQKPFQCTVCLKNYLRSDYLIDHMRGIHGIGDMFVCPDCGEAFRWRFLYGTHRKVCEKMTKEAKEHTIKSKSLTTTTRKKATSADAPSISIHSDLVPSEAEEIILEGCEETDRLTIDEDITENTKHEMPKEIDVKPTSNWSGFDSVIQSKQNPEKIKEEQ